MPHDLGRVNSSNGLDGYFLLVDYLEMPAIREVNLWKSRSKPELSPRRVNFLWKPILGNGYGWAGWIRKSPSRRRFPRTPRVARCRGN